VRRDTLAAVRSPARRLGVKNMVSGLRIPRARGLAADPGKFKSKRMSRAIWVRSERAACASRIASAMSSFVIRRALHLSIALVPDRRAH
jgi:hypothetical protein